MRKRDDYTGEIYRVVQRPKGSDEEWVHSNYATYGKPRTYTTLGAARAQRGRYQNQQTRNLEYQWKSYLRDPDKFSKPVELEFEVQRAPVVAWEMISE